MKALLAGRYVVTKDTPNPSPDRRSKSFMNAEVWKAGTRVKVRSLMRGDELEPPGTLLLKGIIEGPDSTQVYFHSELAQDKMYRQANALTDNLAPEPERLGYVLQDEGFHQPGAHVLAVLLEQGTVTMEQVRAALAHLNQFTDGDYEQFTRLHAI